MSNIIRFTRQFKSHLFFKMIQVISLTIGFTVFLVLFSLAMKDLGKFTKVGASLLVMAIVGGAFMPGLQGLIIDAGGVAVNDTSIMGVAEVNFSFVLPFICFMFIAFYGHRVYKTYMINSNL